MYKFGMWIFDALIPSMFAGWGVGACIYAHEAQETGSTGSLVGYSLLALGLFSLLFSYLRWTWFPAARLKKQTESESHQILER